MTDKKGNGAGRALPINTKPPQKLLIGSEVEILMQWGTNKPVIWQKMKVTGDEQKDTIALVLPISYEGGVMRFVNPNDPTQRFELKVFKAGTLDKELKKMEEKQTRDFKGQIKDLKKPKPKDKDEESPG